LGDLKSHSGNRWGGCFRPSTRPGASPSLAERIAELDERGAQIEVRLGEIQRSLATIAAKVVDPVKAGPARDCRRNPAWSTRRKQLPLRCLLKKIA
jgi:hypothetical protein